MALEMQIMTWDRDKKIVSIIINWESETMY